MTSAPWLHPTGSGWRLDVRVQPGARTTTVVGELGDRLKLRLAAPPVDGKANAELVRYLAERLGVSRRSVRIVAGETSRSKSVHVDGTDVDPERQLVP